MTHAESVSESQVYDKLLTMATIVHVSPAISLLRHDAEMFIARREFRAAKQTLMDMMSMDPTYSYPYYLLSTFSAEYGVILDAAREDDDTEKDEGTEDSGELVPLAARKEYALHVLRECAPRHYGAMIALGKIYREEGMRASS